MISIQLFPPVWTCRRICEKMLTEYSGAFFLKHEKALEIINEVFMNNPQLEKSASILELRAKSKIDLAKKCMDSARKSELSPKMKGNAREQCQTYLKSAEIDLNRALDNVTTEIERSYILEDLKFLESMQQRARKPRRKNPPKANKK
jgi:hypothetical protein